MKRYAIWDKVSNVFTPSGEMFTAEQWMERYPIAKNPNVVILCDAGDFNGGLFATLNQLKQAWEIDGADFSSCTTNEEVLEMIEALEDARNAEIANAVSSEERIAAALEAQNLMAMDDIAE